MDFYRAAVTQAAARPESHYLKLARGATVLWGVVLFLIGLVARHWGSVLEAGLSIASILYGGLLGVFLLGVLTRKVGEAGAITGMLAGLALMLYIKFARVPIAWTWYVAIGTSVTFAVGCLVSLIAPAEISTKPEESNA
jgi:Na+/proline symporter